MPQSFYDLKLKADLNATNGHFLALTNNQGRSRVWAQRIAGSNSWQDTPINPDLRGNGPKLNVNTNTSATSDTFQVTVYFINALPTDCSAISISAIFTPFAHNQLPVVSPFRDAKGNVQSIVLGTWTPSGNSGNISLHPDTGPGEHAIVFTPGAFSIDPAVVPPGPNGGKWSFEFTIVAQFTFVDTNKGTRQFAYDPEMEIDVSTSGEKPVPKAAKA